MRSPSRRDLVKYSLTAALLLYSGALVWPRHAVEIETVVGPSIPGRYKHAPSACELPNGDIFLAYYSGSGEYGNDTAIYATRWDHHSRVWSRPRIIADEPEKAEGNPVVWRDPDDQLWLFYPVRQGATWATATLTAQVSVDGGKTWKVAQVPTTKTGIMTRARPIVLSNGDYLLPVDYNPSTDTEFVSEESCSFFLRYNATERKWSETPRISSRLGNHQPAVVELDERYLVTYCRRGGDYFGREDGFLVRSESHDGGQTWSDGADTSFPNPNAPVDFVKLMSGHLLIAYNDSNIERSPLTVAISTDRDQNYSHRRDIISGDGFSFSYPCVLQTRDGEVHIFFTAGARSHIKHATFQESAIIGN